MISSTPNGVVVELTVDGFYVTDTSIGGETFHRIGLGSERGGVVPGIGAPELPVLARLVSIPDLGSVHIKRVDVTEAVVAGYHVAPLQPPCAEDSMPSAFELDASRYAKDEFYPAEWARVGSPMIMRDLRCCQLVLRPVRHNPVRREVSVATKLRVELEFTSSGGVNEKEQRRTGTSPEFASLYSTFALNYRPRAPHDSPEPGSYLVICHDDFVDALPPLVDWKTWKGLEVVWTTTSQIGGSDSTSVYNYIHNAYTGWISPPAYVLLVGDAPNYISGCHYPDRPWIASDLGYSLHEGDDILADVLLARICCRTLAEAQTVINKLVAYESAPSPDNSTWHDRAIAVAGHDPANHDRFTAVVRRIRDELVGREFGQFDTLFEIWGMNESGRLTDSLNQGRSWLLYRGHGDVDEWSNVEPPWENVDISALDNGGMLPMVCSPTCRAGDFDHLSNDCLAEVWLKAGQPATPKGGSGCFASSWDSYSGWNDTLAVGMFLAHAYSNARFAACCQMAKLRMIEAYPPTPGSTTELQVYEYNNFGEPELYALSSMPVGPHVTHPLLVPVGASSFTVTVSDGSGPVQEALVYVFSDDDPTIRHAAYTDGIGRATFAMEASEPGDEITVRVTGKNILKHESSSYVETPFPSGAASATGPNQGRHIERDPSTGTVHIVYHDDANVHYASSTDNGASWDRVDLGPGQWPSVDVDFNHCPWVTFWRDHDIVASIQQNDGSWVEQTVFEPNPAYVEEIGPPALVVSNKRSEHPVDPERDLGYAVFSRSILAAENEPPLSRICVSAFDQDGVYLPEMQGRLCPAVLDEADLDEEFPLGSPCIAKTPGDWLHVTWQRDVESGSDSIMYTTTRYELEPQYVRSQLLTVSDFEVPVRVSSDDHGPCGNPAVEAWGEHVYAVWRYGYSDASIIKRRRNITEPYNIWDVPYAIVEPYEFMFPDYPVLSTGYVTAWEDADDDYEVREYWEGDYSKSNLSNSPLDSRYPHVVVEFGDGQSTAEYLHCIWTEEAVPGQDYEVVYRRWLHAPADRVVDYVFYSPVLGESLPSPYCVARDGRRSVRGRTADYAARSLVYSLPHLDPAFEYLLRLEASPCGDRRWVGELSLDGRIGTQISCEPARFDTFWQRIPAALHSRDVSVVVRLERLLGDMVSLSGLALYQVDPQKSGGGPAGEWTSINATPALHPCQPSVFASRCAVTYSVPSICDMSLDVFALDGRHVRTLARGAIRVPGTETRTWDGLDDGGELLPAGVYVVRLTAGGTSAARKVVVSR